MELEHVHPRVSTPFRNEIISPRVRLTPAPAPKSLHINLSVSALNASQGYGGIVNEWTKIALEIFKWHFISTYIMAAPLVYYGGYKFASL